MCNDGAIANAAAAQPLPTAKVADPAMRETEYGELLTWIGRHGLSVAEHLPLLRALGVKRVNGRIGSLKPLRQLTFGELSKEILADTSLPCYPHCTADKAAIYEALQEDLKRDPR